MNLSATIDALPITITSRLGGLVCLELLRHLPQKRAVFKGTFDDRLVVIKCFFGRHGHRDYLREYKGLKGFQKAGVSTPDLLFHCKVNADDVVIKAENISTNSEKLKDKFWVIVTRYLEDSIPFDRLWKEPMADNQRLVWLYRITRMLGQLYKSGVFPSDIHLDNMLIKDQAVWIIDGGGVSVSRTKLSRSKALDNFTLFLSILAPRHEKFVHKLYLALTSFIPEYGRVKVENLLEKIHKWRKWRERYLKKTLRTCSDFSARKTFFYFQVVNRHKKSSDLSCLLETLDESIASGQLIKTGKTNTVSVVKMKNGQKVIVKRYKSTKCFSWLRMLKKSRAKNSWVSAWMLKMIDIETPEPLALVEKKIGSFVTCSYVITQYIPGIQLINYFDSKAWPEDEEVIVRMVKDYLLSLERSYISHGDLKATNFIVHDSKVYLIDLDSMKSYKNFDVYQPFWKQDTSRFMQNWHENPYVMELFQSR